MHIWVQKSASIQLQTSSFQADAQVTLWDMSVEDDHEGELPPGAEHYPPQLLFLHMGQQDVKELRSPLWAANLANYDKKLRLQSCAKQSIV